VRLRLNILYRNWGKGEDFRYRKWHQEAGDKWWWQMQLDHSTESDIWLLGLVGNSITNLQSWFWDRKPSWMGNQNKNESRK